jgi:hypothetical protein
LEVIDVKDEEGWSKYWSLWYSEVYIDLWWVYSLDNDDWFMQFHPAKCTVLTVTNKRNPIVTEYSIRGQLLAAVTSARYLWWWGSHTGLAYSTSGRTRVLYAYSLIDIDELRYFFCSPPLRHTPNRIEYLFIFF